jgi:hypothetical protein
MKDELTMRRSTPAIIRLFLYSSFILQPSSFARADGGAIRLREHNGGYQITVFTSATPFRAGPVDLSVLIQDAATEEYVPDARVTVRLTARGTGAFLEYPATTEAATNKLLRAAEFQLPEPGLWDVAVAVEGPHGPALVRFEVQADEPPPRWQQLWPWFGWPAVAVALFGIHLALARRKAPSVREPGAVSNQERGTPGTLARSSQPGPRDHPSEIDRFACG